MKSQKTYLAPQIEKIEICLKDILTESTGHNELEPDLNKKD